MRDQIITSEDNLEDKLTEVWETFSEDIIESLFDEWMLRLERVIEPEGEYYIDPHCLNRNRIYRSPRQLGVITFVIIDISAELAVFDLACRHPVISKIAGSNVVVLWHCRACR
jgi:hypothetical protein